MRITVGCRCGLRSCQDCQDYYAGQDKITATAVKAITQAAAGEHNFAGWLAGVLATAAATLGGTDQLTAAARPGSWEASLIDHLVKCAGDGDDEDLPVVTP